MLLSRSKLLSSFLASCLSLLVGFLLEPATSVAGRGPAAVKLGLW